VLEDDAPTPGAWETQHGAATVPVSPLTVMTNDFRECVLHAQLADRPFALKLSFPFCNSVAPHARAECTEWPARNEEHYE
jgi:hypothetical protein